MIIATAGHIDHGKTAIVKVLTGRDTDRLPEEKQRGMSIDLGFAYPDFGDGTVLGFVDVPGHERFIRNMLAGVTGIDAALLVVAADDGPMPQTHEHLAILDLLGISAGAVALTKIDRVDAARAGDVAGDIERLLLGTALAGAPVFPVSALTGDGVAALCGHLKSLPETAKTPQAETRFRLAIDRAFTLSGIGRVVTGTVFSGSIRAGDSLVLSPPGTRVRVRGLYVQDRPAIEGSRGQRCAVNIAGAGPGKLEPRRGDWLLDAFADAPTARLDAEIRVLASETRALAHWTPVHVHCGTSDVTGRVAVLGQRAIAADDKGFVQLVLDHEIGALKGDRLILRDQSARRTIGGGTVIDPFAPKRGRAKPNRLAALRALTPNDPAAALAGLLATAPEGVDLRRFARTCNLTDGAVAEIWAGAEMACLGPAARPIGLAEARRQSLREMILGGLADWHRDYPDIRGAAAEKLRRALPERISQPLFNAIVGDLMETGEITEIGGALRQPGFQPRMTAADAKLWNRIGPLLEAGELRPPIVRELAAETGLDDKAAARFLVRCTRLGLVIRVTANRFYPPQSVIALATAAEAVAARAPGGLIFAADYRDHTEIGRNLTIEVLEYFDRVGFTKREGDARSIRRPAGDVLRQQA